MEIFIVITLDGAVNDEHVRSERHAESVNGNEAG